MELHRGMDLQPCLSCAVCDWSLCIAGQRIGLVKGICLWLFLYRSLSLTGFLPWGMGLHGFTSMFVSTNDSIIIYASNIFYAMWQSIQWHVLWLIRSMCLFSVGKLLYVCIFCYYFACILLHLCWLGAAWAVQLCRMSCIFIFWSAVYACSVSANCGMPVASPLFFPWSTATELSRILLHLAGRDMAHSWVAAWAAQ